MERAPGSQSRKIMKEKERIARDLLARGLTVQQICIQLRCSTKFVYKIRKEMEGSPAN